MGILLTRTLSRSLNRERVLGRRFRCRIVPYLNNVVEQDHRSIKRRVNASLAFRSFAGAQCTIQDYEAMHLIGRPKSDGGKRVLGIGDLVERYAEKAAEDDATPDAF